MIAGFNDQLENVAETLAKTNINGVILMNETPASTISYFKQIFKISPTIATDQEGGTVQRYKSEGQILGASDMAAQKSPSEAYDIYLKDALYLKSIGITVNFAPVVDVISALPSPLPGRMFSDSPTLVTDYAAQAIKAQQQAGINPVIKHFPGLGSTTTNTDYGSASTDALSILETRDLVPYKNLANLRPSVMVSNAIVPGLSDGQPAIWSKKAIDLLRSLGYQNAVVYSDSLTAQAIPGSIEAAAVKAWQAGIDVVVIVQDKQSTTAYKSYIDSIIEAGNNALESSSLSGKELNQSILRILTDKHIDACTVL